MYAGSSNNTGQPIKIIYKKCEVFIGADVAGSAPSQGFHVQILFFS